MYVIITIVLLVDHTLVTLQISRIRLYHQHIAIVSAVCVLIINLYITHKYEYMTIILYIVYMES